MKRLWIFILIVWSKIRIRLRTKKQREKAKLNDAVMFGAEMERLYRQCDLGEIGVDFEHGLYQMSSKEYQDHICLGPYTEPNEMKAHLYFGNIRQWMNIRRAQLSESIEYSRVLPPLDKEDPIVWGVANDEGKLYLTGIETRTKFEVHPVEITKTKTKTKTKNKNESNTKSASAT